MVGWHKEVDMWCAGQRGGLRRRVGMCDGEIGCEVTWETCGAEDWGLGGVLVGSAGDLGAYNWLTNAGLVEGAPRVHSLPRAFSPFRGTCRQAPTDA